MQNPVELFVCIGGRWLVLSLCETRVSVGLYTPLLLCSPAQQQGSALVAFGYFGLPCLSSSCVSCMLSHRQCL
jgi:hypothetical protein